MTLEGSVFEISLIFQLLLVGMPLAYRTIEAKNIKNLTPFRTKLAFCEGGQKKWRAPGDWPVLHGVHLDEAVLLAQVGQDPYQKFARVRFPISRSKKIKIEEIVAEFGKKMSKKKSLLYLAQFFTLSPNLAIV